LLGGEFKKGGRDRRGVRLSGKNLFRDQRKGKQEREGQRNLISRQKVLTEMEPLSGKTPLPTNFMRHL